MPPNLHPSYTGWKTARTTENNHFLHPARFVATTVLTAAIQTVKATLARLSAKPAAAHRRQTNIRISKVLEFARIARIPSNLPSHQTPSLFLRLCLRRRRPLLIIHLSHAANQPTHTPCDLDINNEPVAAAGTGLPAAVHRSNPVAVAVGTTYLRVHQSVSVDVDLELVDVAGEAF